MSTGSLLLSLATAMGAGTTSTSVGVGAAAASSSSCLEASQRALALLQQGSRSSSTPERAMKKPPRPKVYHHSPETSYR